MKLNKTNPETKKSLKTRPNQIRNLSWHINQNTKQNIKLTKYKNQTQNKIES